MVYIIAAAVLCGFDQLLKSWITTHISLGESMSFLPGVLGLTNVRNTGMAFSLLSGHTWLLAAVSVAAIAVIGVLLVKKDFTVWEKSALTLIMGGAAGNAIDRIFLGYVVDMFSVEFVDFAVFNLADAFINVGAVLFVVLYIVRMTKEDRKRRGHMPEVERLKSGASASAEDSRAREDNQKSADRAPDDNAGCDVTGEDDVDNPDNG
ncbi:MAG: signal peptidase II [Oscillospiraceae bacterium]